MRDTRDHVQQIYDVMLLRLSPGERVKMCCRMFGTAMKLVRAGILAQHHQGIDLATLRREQFLRVYGEDFSPEQISDILPGLSVPANGNRLPSK